MLYVKLSAACCVFTGDLPILFSYLYMEAGIRFLLDG